MTKRFTITTAPEAVDKNAVPFEYRIDFNVGESIHIPEAALVPVTKDFPLDGDYTAVAGLYDAAGVLLGKVGTVSFTVTGGGTVTKDVNAVGSLAVEDVAPATPTPANPVV